MVLVRLDRVVKRAAPQRRYSSKRNGSPCWFMNCGGKSLLWKTSRCERCSTGKVGKQGKLVS
jgi:hypothetical protein